jgi:exodeoxyribonuclease-3
MIVSRIHAEPVPFGESVGYLPARAAAITVPAPDGPVLVVGAYVPSRDAGLEKTERKQKWLAACSAALAARDPDVPAVFLGDLNILEPGHRPHYSFFAPFEYDFYRALCADHGFVDAFRQLHPDAVEHSWVGRTGDGYRYDHVFCSAALAPSITGCEYLHQPREERLSDHSALTVSLTLRPSSALPVSDPVAAVTPATLF